VAVPQAANLGALCLLPWCEVLRLVAFIQHTHCFQVPTARAASALPHNIGALPEACAPNQTQCSSHHHITTKLLSAASPPLCSAPPSLV
jgi:hypothetical protein